MQELQRDFHRCRSWCSHASMGFDSKLEAPCCGLARFDHVHGTHEHACTSAAMRECFACQQPQAADNWACQCAHSSTFCQMHQEATMVGAHQEQHSCHSHHCMWPQPEQEARSCIESVPQSLAKEAGEEPVEYEYYVWDAAAQEYVQTDQKTGERMLQDPHYFQYHYKLVENSQHGEAHMVPERMDRGGFDDYEERKSPSEVPLVDQEPHCFGRSRKGPDNEVGLAMHERQLISTPTTLITPRKQHCCSPSVAPHVSYVLPEPPLTPRCHHHGIRERGDHTSSTSGIKNQSKGSQVRGREAELCECDAHNLARGSRRTTRDKSVGLTSVPVGAVPLNMRTFLSCSRPWENPSLNTRDRELRVRQLKHLQRVQQLEKEELVRRQLILDEMAASLPKLSKHISTSEFKNRRAQSPVYADDQVSAKKTSRPHAASSVSGVEGRVRTDPVNRGRYFRAKWKNDRFLEQQKHPAFDVKAYDAWLKSSGHLLRARALELQQEEQRLVSMLQQERKGRMRRCVYPS